MPVPVMQNAKDSFYLTLRSRLAAINPERTVLLRGALRPAIILEEAEAPFSELPAGVFIVHWLGMGADMHLDSAMIALECEITYCTSGTQAFGGLDRGRLLTAMDHELVAMLQPYSAQKFNYSTQAPASMRTQIFWEEPTFTPINVQRDRLTRSARLMVYSYEEQGE
jgi:hypothetical protein